MGLHIEILGTESLGVRGHCCVVEAENRKILIDPGVALGYRRHGLLPHPVQAAVGGRVRRRILAELEDTTDVVMSHFPDGWHKAYARGHKARELYCRGRKGS